MRVYRLCAFAGALILAIGVGLVPMKIAEGNAERGRPIYEKYCLICHGPQGHGDGPLGKSLQPPATNFFSPESRNKPDIEWMRSVREGHPETAMRDWEGELYDEEIQDVIAYVRKLAGKPDQL